MDQSKLQTRLTQLQEEMQDIIKDELTIFKRKFKIHAEEKSYIEKVYVYNEDVLISEALNKDGYFELNFLNYELDAENSSILTIRVDLSNQLTANDRIRLDIESAEDIDLKVAKKKYIINNYYPVKGEYLSVFSN